MIHPQVVLISRIWQIRIMNDSLILATSILVFYNVVARAFSYNKY